MKLLPRETDKLIIVQVGFLAQRRLARGLQLNYTEATALICTVLLEHVRDGVKSLTEIAALGATLLGKRLVLPQTASMLDHVSLEATFPDGTKLITVHDPITSLEGDLAGCLYGSFLPVPQIDKFPNIQPEFEPGELVLKEENVNLNKGRKRICLTVTNNGDRPIQVGSHYHFIESNALLCFDRQGSAFLIKHLMDIA
jgi:urease